MEHDNTEYVIVGKIGSTYGIKGWVKVLSYTESMTDILEYTPWYLEEGQAWKPVRIDDGHEYGKGLIVHITGFDNPETARALAGKVVAVQRAQLPALKKQEYYWTDLEGLTVIDQHGETLGKVIYLIETGSNDVLVVKGKTEFGIPYLLGNTVIRVDLEKKEIHVNWDLI